MSRAPPSESTHAIGLPEGSVAGAREPWAGAKRATPVDAAILSARTLDGSTGTNAAELERVVLPRFRARAGQELGLFAAPNEA